MISIKNEKEIKLMEDVCKIVAKFYELLEKEVKPGISTFELDRRAEKIMRDLGGIPAQIGYDPGIKGVPPYRHATCISVNDEVIHGVPIKNKIIKEGDLVSVDTVILKNGFNGDAARTFICGGKTSKDAQRLVDVTKAAFYEGIKYDSKNKKIILAIAYSNIANCLVFSFFSNKFYENIIAMNFLKNIIFWWVLYLFLVKIDFKRLFDNIKKTLKKDKKEVKESE